MRKILLIFIILFSYKMTGHSQSSTGHLPELKVSYFGNNLFRPGMSVGMAFPFSGKKKYIEKSHRKNGQYILTKLHYLKIGSNFSFYHHYKDHNGFLLNTELTWHRIKNKSFSTHKYKHLELSVGLGYFRYQLFGTTFQQENDSFEKINGNGNAFMPSLSLAWGKNIRAFKNVDMRYFIKPSVLFEIPYSSGIKINPAIEIGIISKINFKNTKKNNR